MAILAASACHTPTPAQSDAPSSDATSVDGQADAMNALGWNPPEDYGQTRCVSPTLNRDMLELFCAGTIIDGTANGDGMIFRETRPDSASWFGTSTVVSPSNSATDEAGPDLAEDGLTLYFTREVSGGVQGPLMKIHRATRTPGGAFDAGTRILEIDQKTNQFNPSISRDGTAIVWEVHDDTTPFWTSRLLPATNTWSTPAAVLGISGSAHAPMFAQDGSTLYFSRSAPGGTTGSSGIYAATLDPTSGVYNAAMPLQNINDDTSLAVVRTDPWISSDGQHLFFTRRPLVIEGNTTTHLMHALHQ